MSKFTELRDKIEKMFKHAFELILPIGEHVVVKTGQDIAAAALAGTVHGSDDMIAVAKQSLNAQLPGLKNEALTAAAALMADHAGTEAAQPKEGI